MVKSTTESVTVSKLSSELTIGLSRESGTPGDITIGGILFKLGTTEVIPSATVELWVNGIYKGSAKTNSSGRYLFTATVGEGRYDIYTHWDGNDTYWAADSPLVVGNYSRIATAISISVSPNSGAPPLSVRITGILSTSAGSPLGGKTADLYRDGAKIKSMTTKQTSPGQGAYDFTDILETPGGHTYYVEFKGDDTYAGCDDDESLPCTICGHPIPLGTPGSEVVCPICHSIFETVIA